MNLLEIKTEVKVYEKPSELPLEVQVLVKRAADALRHAYAPYSNFRVGAALLLDDGQIITGSNQENASFPLGLCAERVALANKAANFPKQKIKAIAVSVENKKAGSPASPCGMCRQALLEAELKQNSPIQILLKGPTDEVYVIDSVKQLLPLPFSSVNL
ncbi:MAG TPA: cytidine deaminase [Chitinophagales bacterium]|nr:cytidine deaminase [Chitinophagales bacterium]